MSADNGVYVFPVYIWEWSNQDQKMYKPNSAAFFYVAHMQNIENMEYIPDRKDGYNSDSVISMMIGLYPADVKRFDNLPDALMFAHKMANEMTICEYGVGVMADIEIGKE